MANPGSMNTPSGGNAGTKQAEQAPSVPFVRASAEAREQGNVDKALLMTTGDQALGTFDIPANGYLAGFVILVEATGGTGAGAVGAEDAPWSALKNITIQEPSGGAIPYFNTGYELMLANKFGGYWFANDPRQSRVFSAITGTGGNFTWMARVPLSLNVREALGALPNQDAQSSFKFKADLARSTEVYSTPPATTLPTVRVRAWAEEWEQPQQMQGDRRNQTEPPAMNTTQFWTSVPYPVNAGLNKIRLTRMGNYVRNFVFVFRRASTSRVNGEADWPAQTTLWFDKRPKDIIDVNVWRHQVWERYGYFGTLDTAGAPENGVYPYDFAHEFTGKVGAEDRDLWLETIGSSRVEFEGTFANAGTLTVIYNDVAVAGNVFL